MEHIMDTISFLFLAAVLPPVFMVARIWWLVTRSADTWQGIEPLRFAVCPPPDARGRFATSLHL